MHARILHGWLTDSEAAAQGFQRKDVVGYEAGGVLILASTLLEMYREMCMWKGIEERPWNPVAKELRALVGDHKRYVWVERDGVKHRLRAYLISFGASGARVVPESRLRHDAPAPAIDADGPSLVAAPVAQGGQSKAPARMVA